MSILQHKPALLIAFDVVGPLVQPTFVLVQLLTVPSVRHHHCLVPALLTQMLLLLLMMMMSRNRKQ